MNIFSTFLLFFSTLLFASSSADPYKNIHYFKLDNGLKVYLLSDRKSTNTQIKLEVNVGTSVENSKNAGISHLLEHLIFRDKRVPYRDYIDYLEEEGATYINAYTDEYKSVYEATMDAKKSYFLVDAFATMIFDKKLNRVDLEVEQRALQTEIGEVKWYNTLAFYFGRGFKYVMKVFPESQDIFVDSFSLEKQREELSLYQQKLNNKTFTLRQVMQHYDAYYYPQNMTLKIAGNFNLKKMKKLIQKKYGSIEKAGFKETEKLAYNAKLSQLPFHVTITGESDRNEAYIGTRFLLDNYKKYLILLSYSEHLANKTQQLLRNKLGQTYSVKSYKKSLRNAALVGVVLKSLHKDFDENIALIQKKIADDVIKMPKSEIEESLHQSALYYSSLEHDSETLLSLIQTQEFLHLYQNIYNKTAYEIFNAITPQEFQKVLTKSFRPRFSFLYIYRDYYLFPFDMAIFLFFSFGVILYIAKRMAKLSMINKNIKYSSRDIRFSRRLTSYFVSFLVMGFIFFMTLIINSWIEYYSSLYLFDYAHYIDNLDKPWNYLYFFIYILLFFMIFITITLLLFRKFFTRIDVTENNIYIVGVSIEIVNKFEIQEIKKVPWSFSKVGKIYGVKILFFRSVVMIKTKEKVFYLRSNSATELEEDLLKWLRGCNKVS